MAVLSCKIIISSLLVSILLEVSAGNSNIISTEKFSHSAVLDNEERFHLFWKFADKTMTFEVHCKTQGYVGFGLSPNGGMTDADIVIGGVKQDGTNYFSDYHAVGKIAPIVDKVQNWKLLEVSQTDMFTVLKFRRDFDTCDDEDMIITSGTMRVIWAYGPSDSIEHHGSRRGTKSIHLTANQVSTPITPNDAITWTFTVDKVAVPSTDTTYWCEIFKVPALNQKHHAIQFGPIVQPGNEGIVHHALAYVCGRNFTDEELTLAKGDCFAMDPVIKYNCYTEVAFAWAIGGGIYYYPEHAGQPFGEEDSPKFLMFEMHYDNPNRRNDYVDSSGLQIVLTPTLRQYDSAVWMTGHGVTDAQVIPPGVEHFLTRGYCHTDCINEMEESGINVFSVFTHAHLLGRDLRLRHVRNGVELRPIMEDRSYDFNYQEFRTLPQEVKILPNDTLITDCILSSVDRSAMSYGGYRTNDEMCLSFLTYYPKMKLPYCLSSSLPDATFKVFGDDVKYEEVTDSTYRRRTYRITEPLQYANMTWKEAMEHVDWTNPETVKIVQDAQLNTQHYAGDCPGNIRLPTDIHTPYLPPPRHCEDRTIEQHSTTEQASGASSPVVNTGRFVLILMSLISCVML